MKYIITIILGMIVLVACQTTPPASSPTTLVGGEIQQETTPAMAATPTGSLVETLPPTEDGAAASAETQTPVSTQTASNLQDASPTPTLSAPLITITSTPESANTDTVSIQSDSAIIVDRNSVALFEQIPDEYLAAARQLRMVYADRSVGMNIDEGLNCLTALSWAQAPAYCRNDYYDTSGATWLNRTFTLADFQSGTVPSLIRYEPDPEKYDRTNWEFIIVDGAWEEVVQQFVEQTVPEYIESKQVFSFQFNYFHVGQGSNIADPQEGFFVDQPKDGYYTNRQRWDISDFEALEAAYPQAIFFHWTTSLARSVGSAESQAFNEQMRTYARENGKILFDVADILSHDETGQPCYDNRDGVEYCNNNRCEDHPDDGQQLLAICQEYTTETEGGHLGSVTGGRMRVAKAFWVLMARIAGWEG